MPSIPSFQEMPHAPIQTWWLTNWKPATPVWNS